MKRSVLKLTRASICSWKAVSSGTGCPSTERASAAASGCIATQTLGTASTQPSLPDMTQSCASVGADGVHGTSSQRRYASTVPAAGHSRAGASSGSGSVTRPGALGSLMYRSRLGNVSRPATSTVQRRGLLHQSFEVGHMHGIRRTAADLGTYASNKARSAGLVPAIVYGPGPSGNEPTVAFWIRTQDVDREMRRRKMSFECTLFDLDLGEGPGGRMQRVVPRHVDTDPVTGKTLNVSFVRYVAGAQPGSKLRLPMEPINAGKCDGIKAGGWVLDLVWRLPVYASGERVPHCLLVDLRGKRIGDKVYAGELALPEGVRLRKVREDLAVCKVVGARL